MADLFLTWLTRSWEPLCHSWCNEEGDQPIRATDVDRLISPEERRRFACALANLPGIRRLHVAAVPRREPLGARPLRVDACQVVYECSWYRPRSRTFRPRRPRQAAGQIST